MAVFRCVPPVPSSICIQRRGASILSPRPRRERLKRATVSKESLKAGDVVLVDDTTGEGHSSRVLGTNRMYL
jgi:hypothetical protein